MEYSCKPVKLEAAQIPALYLLSGTISLSTVTVEDITKIDSFNG